MSTRPPSRVVFVGNIPYGKQAPASQLTTQLANAETTPLLTTIAHLGLSEEQITDIFSDAGKVERFRLVYDSETGRPKGFGFAEYPDTGRSLCLLPSSVQIRRFIKDANTASQILHRQPYETSTTTKSWAVSFASTSLTSRRLATMITPK